VVVDTSTEGCCQVRAGVAIFIHPQKEEEAEGHLSAQRTELEQMEQQEISATGDFDGFKEGCHCLHPLPTVK
jgi:hypothetical protein